VSRLTPAERCWLKIVTFESKLSEEENGPPEVPEPEIGAAQIQIHSPAPPDLLRTASDPVLNEDLALSLLKRSDLHPEVLERLAKNVNALKSRKVRIALASHPHTPRHVSVPMARQFYTFELMKFTLSPSVPADVKVAAEDALISRLNTVTIGERLTLARRSSGRVGAALLLDLDSRDGKIKDDERKIDAKIKAKDAATVARETRVMQTALDNPRLTEAHVISAVLRPAATAALVGAVARHLKWSCRREIRVALLRTEYLSLARALEFSHEIPATLLQEVLASSRLPDKIKGQLLHQSQTNSALSSSKQV
jgi:hypothetical protein